MNLANHNCRKKSTAKKKAAIARDRGFKASVYKKKKGYGVSVTKK